MHTVTWHGASGAAGPLHMRLFRVPGKESGLAPGFASRAAEAAKVRGQSPVATPPDRLKLETLLAPRLTRGRELVSVMLGRTQGIGKAAGDERWSMMLTPTASALDSTVLNPGACGMPALRACAL